MSVTRASWALLLAGCAAATYAPPPCVSNDECGAGNVCFAEGCGNPLTGIVLEVSGNGFGGHFTRDFPIDDGTLGPTRDIDLGEPLLLLGEFQRDRFYGEPVKLQAVGVSEVLPGVSRVFEGRIDQPLRGTYEFALGAGKFRVTATPADTSVPPVTVSNVIVRDGFSPPAVNFAFPTIEQAITLSGRLLKKVDNTQFPAVEVALTATGSAMDLQAFDPETKDPLSQRFPVSSGQPGSNGNFTLTMNPRVRELKQVVLLATPHDAKTPLPSKRFVLNTPLPNTVTLELGDTGAPITVTGVVVDPSDAPMPDAQVLLEGTVMGGGTFRSKIAQTDAAGAFSLEVLQGAEPMKLTVMPPPGSPAGVTTVSVMTPAVSGPVRPGTIKCDQRVLLVGQVLSVDGGPAAKVTVRAVEEPGATARPLPLEETETVTNDDGTFALRLDAASWRLEFRSQDLPMVSRLVTVLRELDALGQVQPQSLLAPIQMMKGRALTGVVTGLSPAKLATPISWATVRVFRVSREGTKSTAILLGTTIADEKGTYTIALPR